MLLTVHEVDRLLQVPGSLGFIEDSHMLDWRRCVGETLVAEVMDVLNESPNLAQRRPLAYHPTPEAPLMDLVARQGLLQNLHERTVTGQEYAVEFVLVVDVLCRGVEADQCLAGSGNPGHETDGLLRAGPRRLDDRCDSARGLTEIGSTRVAARDLGDRMPAIERQRRFDDGGSWLVATRLPLIDPDLRLRHEVQSSSDRLRQTFGVCPRHLEQAIRGARGRNALLIAAGPRADQYGRDVCVVATFMEIVEIQSIVDDLVHVRGGKGLLPDLELENEDDRPDDDERIDSATHARNGEPKVDRAGVSRQHAPQDFRLLEPCVPLSPSEVEIVPSSHPREDLVGVGGTEFGERARVVGSLGGSTRGRTCHVGRVYSGGISALAASRL